MKVGCNQHPLNVVGEDAEQLLVNEGMHQLQGRFRKESSANRRPWDSPIFMNSPTGLPVLTKPAKQQGFKGLPAEGET
jgi:hypothetical protein